MFRASSAVVVDCSTTGLLSRQLHKFKLKHILDILDTEDLTIWSDNRCRNKTNNIRQLWSTPGKYLVFLQDSNFFQKGAMWQN